MDFLKQSSATREDLGLLAVMDALADEEQVTQRELSRRTGLNLKKVNYCLHKLLEKGYIKFQNIVNNPDKRIYLYILTPAGIKAKSHLTYRFLQFTLGFYNQVESKLQQCLKDMSQSGVRKLVLYGATDAARIVLELVKITDIEIVGVVDETFDGSNFNGVAMLEYGDLKAIKWDGVLILVLERLDEVEARICDQGFLEEQIWRL
jgi:EPS-associated MarR family transcriptional regulator